ncbi:hypothetical protein [Elioraea sp.]|uniref:hypothetical protein n=1 Tax=Elioraea sp. TaxID=2185103 RepID=UPI003F6F17AA
MTTRTDARIACRHFRRTLTTRLRSPRAMHFIDGRPVPAATFASEIARARGIDAAVADLTRFGSLAELCDEAQVTGYRPTLRADLDPRFAAIADAFDAEMARRGRQERAFRG